jgi:hypothetical protein
MLLLLLMMMLLRDYDYDVLSPGSDADEMTMVVS